MDSFDLSLRDGWVRKTAGMILPVWWVLGLGMGLAPRAQAGFVGTYSLNNFLLTNTNADGSASTPDGGLSAVLVGGNNGSGLPGTTDLTIMSAALGAVHFDYSYSSLDSPGFDYAGYLVDQTFVQLADTDGQSGSKTIAVNSGGRFGFRVGTMDNTGEPGILTISNFSAPSAGPQTPEPATLSNVLIGLAMAGAAQAIKRRRRSGRPRQENKI